MGEAGMRMNGERPQDYVARRAFQKERVRETKKRGYMIMRLAEEGKPLPVVHVDLPCVCARYPFPHFHAEEDAARERMRFRERFAPFYGRDGQEIRAHGRNVAYFAGSRGNL